MGHPARIEVEQHRRFRGVSSEVKFITNRQCAPRELWSVGVRIESHPTAFYGGGQSKREAARNAVYSARRGWKMPRGIR